MLPLNLHWWCYLLCGFGAWIPLHLLCSPCFVWSRLLLRMGLDPATVLEDAPALPDPCCLLTKASYSRGWKVSHMLSMETQGMTVGASKYIQRRSNLLLLSVQAEWFVQERKKFHLVLQRPCFNEKWSTVLSLISLDLIVLLQCPVGLDWLYQTFKTLP